MAILELVLPGLAAMVVEATADAETVTKLQTEMGFLLESWESGGE